MTELAYQLIHINSEAMNWVNEDGCTPLHVLANKPTSFKSGSHIRGWRNFIYYCEYSDKIFLLLPQYQLLSFTINQTIFPPKKKKKEFEIPSTLSFLPPKTKTLVFLEGIFVNKLEPQTIETLSDEALRKSRSKAKTTDAYFPKNYETCYDFFTSLKVTFLKGSYQ